MTIAIFLESGQVEMVVNRFLNIFIMLLLSVLLANCSETQFIANLMKVGADKVAQPGGGRYKVGGPYQIKGIWYRPRIDYQYDQTGIASWYGPQFHGKLTANGEIFDMNLVSAAHKTLPMPSMVRVTNLRNGKALNIRLNDRGPFAHGRIIDLSKRAAQLLGFERAGTAPVRVQVLERESRLLASASQGVVLPGTQLPGAGSADPGSSTFTPRSAPSTSVTRQTLPPPDGTQPSPQYSIKKEDGANSSPERKSSQSSEPTKLSDEKVSRVAVKANSQIFVQAGAFSQFVNANRVHVQLASLGSSTISRTKQGKERLFRVRLGPYPNVKTADEILARVMGSGFPGARIIVD